MPTLLDDRLVADALTALTGWSGDAQRIVRTVPVSGAAADALLAEIAITADAMNHHPEVDRSGGAIVFGLSTHSEGGVTEYDIALASRIDDLASKVTGGGGTVVGAPTAEGSSSGSRHVGLGQREDGSTRSDTHVPTEAGETAERGEDLSGGNVDRLDPGVGAASARQGTPSVPLPDTAPDAPQPGLGRPEGQGTPPAGQNVKSPADEGSPGDRT